MGTDSSQREGLGPRLLRGAWVVLVLAVGAGALWYEAARLQRQLATPLGAVKLAVLLGCVIVAVLLPMAGPLWRRRGEGSGALTRRGPAEPPSTGGAGDQR